MLTLVMFVFSGPKISSEEKKLLTKVLNAPVPELVQGKIGSAINKSVKINYESSNSEHKTQGTILMINGLSHSMLDWPIHFHRALIDSGYHVIRFDNRDVGMSDWIHDWGKGNYYNLRDMATDALAVLDANQVDKAHIVGMSMGGMITQTLAIEHPDRVLSICSIMSTGHFYDPDLKDTPKEFKMGILKTLLRYSIIKSEANACKAQLSIDYLLKGKGDYKADAQKVFERTLYELRNRKGFNKKSTKHHGVAIAKSGARYEGLSKLNIPALVVHGTDDPLVLFEHGQKYAPMIPNVKTLFIDGMGHDLPEKYSPITIENIVKNIKEV